MKLIALTLALGACGSPVSPEPAKVATTEPTTVSTTVAIDAAASPGKHARVFPDGCTDGGGELTAFVQPGGARYCLDKMCWSFDVATSKLAPIAPIAASPDEVAIHWFSFDKPEPTPAWTATTHDESSLDVCDAHAACTPLRPTPSQNEIGPAMVSSSGERVAVTRGIEDGGRMAIEVYARTSGKRLGSVRVKGESCARLIGFAGESVVVQEWGCANQGGTRYVMSPDGAHTIDTGGYYANSDEFMQVDGDHWAFTSRSDGSVQIVDVVRGKLDGNLVTDRGEAFGVAGKQLFGFGRGGEIMVAGVDGKIVARAAPPTCRWGWEAETIAGVHVGMTGANAIKLLHAPRSQARQGGNHTRWQFDDGLSLVVESVPDDHGGPSTSRVDAIDVVAPSTLRTTAGVRIGMPVAELEHAWGNYVDDARSTATKRVYGNDGEPGGWVVGVEGGVVTSLHAGND